MSNLYMVRNYQDIRNASVIQYVLAGDCSGGWFVYEFGRAVKVKESATQKVFLSKEGLMVWLGEEKNRQLSHAEGVVESLSGELSVKITVTPSEVVPLQGEIKL